jgi:hypothetical protein
MTYPGVEPMTIELVVSILNQINEKHLQKILNHYWQILKNYYVNLYFNTYILLF